MSLPTLPGLPPQAPEVIDAEPIEPVEPVAPGGIVVSEPTRGRMTPAEVATVGHLSTLGMSVPQIAALIGRSPETVRANKRHAKDLLQAIAPEAVELWLQAARVSAAFGKHAAARDLVYAAGAAVPAPQQAQQGPIMQVAIGIQLPGLPTPAAATSRTDDEPDSD